MATEKETSKNPLLEESQGPERKDKHLILGARREGGQMQVIDFAETKELAEAQAKVLVKTGFTTVEVYTRLSAFGKK